MSPAGWVKSALSPHDPMTAVEVRARIPSTVTLTQVVTALLALATSGSAVRHEPTEGAEPRYTLRGTT